MNNRQKILIMNNSIISLINFRKELIHTLIGKNYEVYFTVPESKENQQVKELLNMGTQYVQNSINGRSINPFFELKTLFQLKKIVQNIEPDIILSFTIKPNIYGSYVAKKCKIPIIINITGLGSGFNNTYTKILVETMYKYACKNFI